MDELERYLIEELGYIKQKIKEANTLYLHSVQEEMLDIQYSREISEYYKESINAWECRARDIEARLKVVSPNIELMNRFGVAFHNAYRGLFPDIREDTKIEEIRTTMKTYCYRVFSGDFDAIDDSRILVKHTDYIIEFESYLFNGKIVNLSFMPELNTIFVRNEYEV